MSAVSFDATIVGERRSVTIIALSGGYRVQRDDGVQIVHRLQQALNEAREYLGRFLVRAERGPAWGLRVCVSVGCAFYGLVPPGASGSTGIPVEPDELLVKIRDEYRQGDGPITALNNAIKIARAYPPQPNELAA